MRRPRRMFGSDDMASCMHAMRVLQSYLDGRTDDLTTKRVASHLEACRRCGLEAATYREIKAALARKSQPTDDAAVARLEAFGAELAEAGTEGKGPSPA